METGEFAIKYKEDVFPEGTAVFDVERGQLTDSIIGDLIDIVRKNGARLLNIGPRSDGTIPYQEQENLRQIGQWLAIYGESIYSRSPWKVFGEGPTEIAGGSSVIRRESLLLHGTFASRRRIACMLPYWRNQRAITWSSILYPITCAS